MHRIRRRWPTLVALVVAAVLAAPTLASPAGAARKAPALWRVGQCYTGADVALQTVDLKSTVACSEDHAAQIVAGAALPKKLAKVDHATLLDPGSKAHDRLAAFAAAHCGPDDTVTHLYPKAKDRLRELFTQYDIETWMPPATGTLGWLVPDADSYALGATDVLCVHLTDPLITQSTAGDLRRISTRAPMASMRLCADLGVDGARATFIRCDRQHDIETLLRVALDVKGKPAEVLEWTDGDWGSIDEACQDLAIAVIGVKRNQLLINADTDPAQPVVDGRRTIDCRAVPFDEAKAFGAGTVVTGAGNRPIRMTRA